MMSEKKMAELILFFLAMSVSLFSYVHDTSRQIVTLMKQKVVVQEAPVINAEVTADDFPVESTAENVVQKTEEMKIDPKEELGNLILKKLETADTDDKFSQIWRLSAKHDLEEIRGQIEKKWDEWAITQVKNAKTREELRRAERLGLYDFKSQKLAKQKIIEFDIEDLKKEDGK